LLQKGRAALTTGHISARLPPLQPAGVELTQPEQADRLSPDCYRVIAFHASRAPDAVGMRWGRRAPQQRHRVVALPHMLEAPGWRLAT
jgi:hypothetical protein